MFWTLGLLHFLGLDDNPFNSVIVPVLLCMVGFTDGVHMMVQIRRHRASGMCGRMRPDSRFAKSGWHAG